jgi:hypothetical protein
MEIGKRKKRMRNSAYTKQKNKTKNGSGYLGKALIIGGINAKTTGADIGTRGNNEWLCSFGYV